MIRRLAWLALAAGCLLAFPQRAPAPLIYRPGEGWSYEPVGKEGKWRRERAKDQLEVAQQAFDAGQYSLALKAARSVVKRWPLSDYAPEAQYLVGRAYEARHHDEKAFKEYQKILTRYPRSGKYNDVLRRQYEIAGRFLAGQWRKIWGFLPFFPSNDRTAEMFAQVVGNGPQSEVAPPAQLKIGETREKQRKWPLAARAYNTAFDRYNDQPKVAAEALYRAGEAYRKQALRADYDQTTAGLAIASFNDFAILYPDEPRVPQTRQAVEELKLEQARGSFETARYYEKNRRWGGALVYYNEAQNLAPESSYAALARQRMDEIKQRIQRAAK